MGGWFLSDDANDFRKFEIPAGTTIPANGYAVFQEDTHFGAGNPRTPFALSENGETVFLTSGAGGFLTGYSDEEAFGASETNISLGRYFKASTNTYNFVALESATPGGPNANPKVGPIVISEIMYHPQDAPAGNPDAEYIELYNLTTAPITLQDVETRATWRLSGGVDLSFPRNTTIPPQGRLLIVRDEVSFNSAYNPGAAPVLRWDTGKLDNGGERIQLSMPGDVDDDGVRQYIRVDRVVYDDEAPWPTSPDGEGGALHRKQLDAYGNDVANWQAGPPSPGN